MSSSESTSDPSAAQRSLESGQLPWYLSGVASWYASMGLQAILFPWLTTIVLAETPERVGIAQTCMMLPGMLLMLVGGLASDRSDCRTLLIRIHLLSAVPPLVLAAAIAAGDLSYLGLIGYALAVGSFGAFAVPARDSLLTRVASGEIQRTVTATMGIQNVSQLLGIALGGAAVYTGAPAVLVAQSAILLVGVVAVWRLAPAPPTRDADSRAGLRGALAEIREGLEEVIHSPRILPVTVLSIAIGLLFMGTFMVAMPLLVRDVYGGSSPEIAGLNASMFLGMLSAIAILLMRGGVHRQGLALVVSLIVGGAMLGCVSLRLPLPGVYLLIYLWGACGGVAMTASRTLVQEAASETHRARVLSVYQLGFSGAAPIGALAMGFAVRASGAAGAILYPSLAMIATVVVVALVSGVGKLVGAPRAASLSRD